MRRWNKLRRRRLGYLGLLFVEREVATTAKIVRCTELNEKTAVTPYNFPGINRG
jgi:hypothetical protein